MTNLSQVKQPSPTPSKAGKGWALWGRDGQGWVWGGQRQQSGASFNLHDSHCRMSWPGFAPIASSCSATTWSAAGS